MPNYIKNRLIIKGTTEQIEKVKSFLTPKEPTLWDDQDESVAMDFNNITPMPKWVYRGNLGINEEKKYGKDRCWYEWSVKNWGTKWNAFCSSSSGNVIEFETAWNGVVDLMSKLAIIFPNVEFEYMYADEDVGYNVGSYIFKDTDIQKQPIVQGSKKAYELAFELWNRWDEFVWDENENKYRWKEEY